MEVKKMNDVKNGENSKIMGILSMVFGIVAIVISWVPTGRIIVLVLGFAAVVLGAIAIGKIDKNLSEKCIKNMAIAGIVLGSLAIVFSILATVAFGFIASHWLKGDNMMEQWKMPGLGKWRHL
jgi:uncharacterized membrane protein